MEPDASSPVPGAPSTVTTEALAAVAAARRVNRALRVSLVDDAVRARAAALLDEAAALLEADVHDGPHCQIGFGVPSFGEGATPAQYFPLLAHRRAR